MRASWREAGLVAAVGLAAAAAFVVAGGQGAPPLRVGRVGRDAAIVPTSQLVAPAGRVVEYAGRPVDLALSADGRTVYVKDNKGLAAVDAASWKLLQRLPIGGGSFHGIVAGADGRMVYATLADSTLAECEVLPDRTLRLVRRIPLAGAAGSPSPFPCGVALGSSGAQAVVCFSVRNSLGLVDLAAGKLTAEVPVGVAPWGVVLSPDGRTAYVTNWGGDRPGEDDDAADSAGTPTRVDYRGVASSGSVSIVDLAARKVVATVPAGLHPCDLALTRDGKRLFVANANSDTVTVIDAVKRRVERTLPMRPDARLPFGSAPTGLALAPDGRTLYVTCGGANAVALVSLAKGAGAPRIAGWIPTAWYPGAVAADAGALYVANVKGMGSLDTDPQTTSNPKDKPGAWSVYSQLGVLQAVPVPAGRDLADMTRQVLANSRAARAVAAASAQREKRARPAAVPVPARVGDPSVFEHVVYVIKENRTYDQVFGDLKQGNGDPSLCVFGREVSPNHHALAEEFVLLDNYYCNGVNSADGHSWSTEGYCTDHLEKAQGGYGRSYTFGDDPLTYASSGQIWDNVLDSGLTFANYGEMDYASVVPSATFATIYEDYFSGARKLLMKHKVGIERLRRYTHPDYPGWNMSIPDAVRADIFLRELRAADAKGSFPNFTIVYLPNDHTGGDISAKSYVADNDLALGRIVEGISKSRFWAKTCIFVIEDDPQNGFDHVDGHRSLCLVVSPYSRRGAVVSEFYSQTSVLHTMERMLGLRPMNQMDAMAPLMSACFTSRPDTRPYVCKPNTTSILDTKAALNRLRTQSPSWARLAARVRFDKPDAGNDDAMNRIIWRAVKGERAPYPARLAGAHGKVSARLGPDPD